MHVILLDAAFCFQDFLNSLRHQGISSSTRCTTQLRGTRYCSNFQVVNGFGWARFEPMRNNIAYVTSIISWDLVQQLCAVTFLTNNDISLLGFCSFFAIALFSHVCNYTCTSDSLKAFETPFYYIQLDTIHSLYMICLYILIKYYSLHWKYTISQIAPEKE